MVEYYNAMNHMPRPPCCFYHDNVPSSITHIKGERLTHWVTEPVIAKCGELKIVGGRVVCCRMCSTVRHNDQIIYVDDILRVR